MIYNYSVHKTKTSLDENYTGKRTVRCVDEDDYKNDAILDSIFYIFSDFSTKLSIFNKLIGSRLEVAELLNTRRDKLI